MTVLELFSANPPVQIALAGLLGLLVGSFLNVVIYRLPVMMERAWQAQAREALQLEALAEAARFTLAVPRSRCGACGVAIKPWQNIPVLSWLLLRGKAACCGAPIAVRYPLVEALCGLMTALCAWRFGASTAMIAAVLITWVLIAAAFIDFDTQLLPDDLTLPLLWLALLFAVGGWGFAGVTLMSSVIGAMAGYLSLWLVYWGFKLATGKEGMGYGDFKLLAALGAWLGWQALPQIILLSSVVGAVVGITLMATKLLKQGQPMPFGPYLAAAGWLAMMGVNVLALFTPR